jgi:hypothetical protein
VIVPGGGEDRSARPDRRHGFDRAQDRPQEQRPLERPLDRPDPNRVKQPVERERSDKPDKPDRPDRPRQLAQ